jgi:metal-responsive CopG/Arc/MetJ family transcriptional regulator
METIQVVLDSKLLRAADVVARRSKVNRSALILEALRSHLKNIEIREREDRDRKGYEAVPRDSAELSGWEAEAIWPAEQPGATFGFTVLLLRTRPRRS